MSALYHGASRPIGKKFEASKNMRSIVLNRIRAKDEPRSRVKRGIADFEEPVSLHK
jgi:hypothetical protein